MSLQLTHTSEVSGDEVQLVAPDYIPGRRTYLAVLLGGKMVLLGEDKVLELHSMLGKALGFIDETMD